VLLNVGVAIGREDINGGLMDAFQQQDFDFRLVERGLLHGAPESETGGL
jgi:hypothetical protein